MRLWRERGGWLAVSFWRERRNQQDITKAAELGASGLQALGCPLPMLVCRGLRNSPALRSFMLKLLLSCNVEETMRVREYHETDMFRTTTRSWCP